MITTVPVVTISERKSSGRNALQTYVPDNSCEDRISTSAAGFAEFRNHEHAGQTLKDLANLFEVAAVEIRAVVSTLDGPADAAKLAQSSLHSATEWNWSAGRRPTGTALTGCKTAWQDQLRKLIQKTVEAGDALKDSAGNVASTDQEAEHRLDHVMHDWSGK